MAFTCTFFFFYNEDEDDDDDERLTLCSPSSIIGTAARSPTLTFGTDNGAIQNELNPIVLHLWT